MSDLDTTAPDPDNVADFVHGQSDPDDFHAATVVTYLEGVAAADPVEFNRVKTLEAEGRDRTSIAAVTRDGAIEKAEAAYQADLAEAADRPQPGETLPDQGDGYTRVVVSS